MWLQDTLGSSVGKKLLMAVTGLFFCSFLLIHLIGNLILYCGKDAFNSYAANLHSLGKVLYIAEALMLICALIHILTGIQLFFQNRSARPVGYQVNKNGGGRSVGSVSMPYTGIFILIFIVAHLAKFHFGNYGTITIFEIVTKAFADPVVVVFYVISMIILSIHVSHGFWSSFQTFGITHKKYSSVIKITGILFSVFLCAGFGFIPVFILCFI